jgi:hypothetical protein
MHDVSDPVTYIRRSEPVIDTLAVWTLLQLWFLAVKLHVFLKLLLPVDTTHAQPLGAREGKPRPLGSNSSSGSPRRHLQLAYSI